MLFFFKTIVSFLRDENYRGLLLMTSFVLALGTTVYSYLEGWHWIDSLYLCLVMLTTIGFGDLAPETRLGRIFSIFYIIMGVSIILNFISAVYEHYSGVRGGQKQQKKKKKKAREEKREASKIEEPKIKGKDIYSRKNAFVKRKKGNKRRNVKGKIRKHRLRK